MLDNFDFDSGVLELEAKARYERDLKHCLLGVVEERASESNSEDRNF